MHCSQNPFNDAALGHPFNIMDECDASYEGLNLKLIWAYQGMIFVRPHYIYGIEGLTTDYRPYLEQLPPNDARVLDRISAIEKALDNITSPSAG